MTSEYLERPLRPLWKAQADTGTADYFRWTFRHHCGVEYVVSLGKAYRDRTGLCHRASADTSEVLLWSKSAPRNDLLPSQIFPLLETFDRFFVPEAGKPIGLHVPDSIVTSLLYCLEYYLGEAIEHKGVILHEESDPTLEEAFETVLRMARAGLFPTERKEIDIVQAYYLLNVKGGTS